jgi:hypothetical protein
MGHCFQTLSLHVLPPVLVIQLKRFSYVGSTRSKLFTPVQIPAVMQLEGVTYVLYSFSNHYVRFANTFPNIINAVPFERHTAPCFNSSLTHTHTHTHIHTLPPFHPTF